MHKPAEACVEGRAATRKWSSAVLEIIFSILIVALIYAVGVFVKPGVDHKAVAPPAIEKRDRFYGIASAPDRPAVLWMVGRDGKIVRSEDGGKSWAAQPSGVEAALQSVAAWDARHAVAVGDGVVLRTEDGGRRWSRAVTALSAVDDKLLRVRIDSVGRAWAVGAMGMVLLSTDQGKSWRPVAPEADLAWNDIGFSGTSVWLVGEFGRMAVAPFPEAQELGTGASAGGGALAWRQAVSPADRSLTSIHFGMPDRAVAVGLDGTVLQTSDRGSTWSKIPVSSTEHILAVGFDGDRWIATGARGGLLVSLDATGDRWRSERIAPHDYNWHTDFLTSGGAMFAVGGSLVSRQYSGTAVAQPLK